MSAKTEKELLAQVDGIVSQCDRCGTCLPLCPLFGVRDVEAVSARGKNNIARALVMGGFEPSPAVLDAVNFCLLCRACVENCPSKVKTDDAMMAVRQVIADRTGGAPPRYRLIGGIMKSPVLVKVAAGALTVLRKVRLNRLVPYGMAPSGSSRAEFLSAFAGPAALGAPAPASSAPAGKEARVAYFQGCGMRMMFPDAVGETLAILRTVTDPMEVCNPCCGLPHLAHGQREDFLDLAKKNIDLFAGADIVVTDCASCSGMLKHVAAYLAGDAGWQDRAVAFSAKVMELTEYLARTGYQPRQRVDATITYHDPCHLVRGQGIKKQPRDLLKATGRYVEMPGADVCCGGAGSFHMDYPEASAAVLEKKRAGIEKSGADVVVTGCPVCLVQLEKAAKNSGGKFRAMHISQVL